MKQNSSERILIIGQGISGTMLSWFLHKHDVDVIVIDNSATQTPSKTSAGIINPVTGRRVVTVWLDDILLPFAENTYAEMGSYLGIEAIQKTDILDFFPNPFMKESFLKKLSQQAPYISLSEDTNYLSDYFNYEFGSGLITPAYIVQLQTLLPAWRSYLEKENRIITAGFDFTKLKINNDHIVYDGIAADKIIFCDGVQGGNNPFFSLLPFAFNKGEALIIEAPDLPSNHIYKKSMTLVPLGAGRFWTGTNYIWDFEDAAPTETFRKSTEAVLKEWLKVPFTITGHRSSVRPATVERRPFAGFHPVYKNVGILNGMGTKGCSLAPFFAQQLCENILHNTPIMPEADVQRFARVLSR